MVTVNFILCLCIALLRYAIPYQSNAACLPGLVVFALHGSMLLLDRIGLRAHVVRKAPPQALEIIEKTLGVNQGKSLPHSLERRRVVPVGNLF